MLCAVSSFNCFSTVLTCQLDVNMSLYALGSVQLFLSQQTTCSLTKKVFCIFLINCAYADCYMKLFVETVWHNAVTCRAKDAQLQHVMQQ